MTRQSCWLVMAMTVPLFGCKLGPNYVRPDAQFASTWLATDDDRVRLVQSEVATDFSGWWKAFNDPMLDRLIGTAYAQIDPTTLEPMWEIALV